MAGGTFRRYQGLLREGLAELTPRWVQAMFFGVPSAKRIYVGSETRGKSTIAAAALDGGEPAKRIIVADIVLPQSVLLKRPINTPPGASSAHQDIAELDLLRKTPFSAADVDWTLTANTASSVTQWVVKKSDLAGYRRALQAQGYKVRRFLVDQDDQIATLADYTRDIAPRAHLWRRLNAGLVAIILAIASYLWLSPVLAARTDTMRESQTAASLRNEALELREDISALAAADAERSTFLETVVGRPLFIDALRQMTVALPDDVWLTDFQLNDGRLIVKGQTSASAATLVLQLTDANIPFIPALSGPISRTNDGNEQFSIIFTPKAGSL